MKATHKISNNAENISNYRVTFGGYYSFKGYDEHFQKLFKIIEGILELADELGLEEIWWFMEPYAEVTWIDPSEDGVFIEIVKDYLDKNNIEYEVKTPQDGYFVDWVGNEEEYKQIGPARHTLIAKLSRFLLLNRNIVENGIGWTPHYLRCCHVLANQLGFTVKDEGDVLLYQGSYIFSLLYGKEVGGILSTNMLRKMGMLDFNFPIILMVTIITGGILLLFNWVAAVGFVAGNIISTILVLWWRKYKVWRAFKKLLKKRELTYQGAYEDS